MESWCVPVAYLLVLNAYLVPFNQCNFFAFDWISIEYPNIVSNWSLKFWKYLQTVQNVMNFKNFLVVVLLLCLIWSELMATRYSYICLVSIFWCFPNCVLNLKLRLKADSWTEKKNGVSWRITDGADFWRMNAEAWNSIAEGRIWIFNRNSKKLQWLKGTR